MWIMIDSLQPFVDPLAAAFTQPSFRSACQLLLGWVMCLGPPTLRRVGYSAQPEAPPILGQRHGLVEYYNFFERSAWTATVDRELRGIDVGFIDAHVPQSGPTTPRDDSGHPGLHFHWNF